MGWLGKWRLIHEKGLDLVADGFTKPLFGAAFQRFLENLGMSRLFLLPDQERDAARLRSVRTREFAHSGADSALSFVMGCAVLSEAEALEEVDLLWIAAILLMVLGAIYAGKLAMMTTSCCLKRLQRMCAGAAIRDEVGPTSTSSSPEQAASGSAGPVQALDAPSLVQAVDVSGGAGPEQASEAPDSLGPEQASEAPDGLGPEQASGVPGGSGPAQASGEIDAGFERSGSRHFVFWIGTPFSIHSGYHFWRPTFAFVLLLKKVPWVMNFHGGPTRLSHSSSSSSSSSARRFSSSCGLHRARFTSARRASSSSGLLKTRSTSARRVSSSCNGLRRARSHR